MDISDIEKKVREVYDTYMSKDEIVHVLKAAKAKGLVITEPFETKDGWIISIMYKEGEKDRMIGSTLIKGERVIENLLKEKDKHTLSEFALTDYVPRYSYEKQYNYIPLKIKNRIVLEEDCPVSLEKRGLDFVFKDKREGTETKFTNGYRAVNTFLNAYKDWLAIKKYSKSEKVMKLAEVSYDAVALFASKYSKNLETATRNIPTLEDDYHDYLEASKEAEEKRWEFFFYAKYPKSLQGVGTEILTSIDFRKEALKCAKEVKETADKKLCKIEERRERREDFFKNGTLKLVYTRNGNRSSEEDEDESFADSVLFAERVTGYDVEVAKKPFGYSMTMRIHHKPDEILETKDFNSFQEFNDYMRKDWGLEPRFSYWGDDDTMNDFFVMDTIKAKFRGERNYQHGELAANRERPCEFTRAWYRYYDENPFKIMFDNDFSVEEGYTLFQEAYKEAISKGERLGSEIVQDMLNTLYMDAEDLEIGSVSKILANGWAKHYSHPRAYIEITSKSWEEYIPLFEKIESFLLERGEMGGKGASEIEEKPIATKHDRIIPKTAPGKSFNGSPVMTAEVRTSIKSAEMYQGTMREVKENAAQTAGEALILENKYQSRNDSSGGGRDDR